MRRNVSFKDEASIAEGCVSEHVKRRGRIVSIDSNALAKHRALKKSELAAKLNRRCRSAEEPSDDASATLMNPLSFENIDLVNTPLSSLRSCSEYQRRVSFNIESKESVCEEQPRKSVWSRLSMWSPRKRQSEQRKLSADRTPVRKSDEITEEERDFLLERLRFNPANLMEGEDYNYGSSSSSTANATATDRRGNRLSGDRQVNCSMQGKRESVRKSFNQKSPRKVLSQPRNSFFRESSLAFEMVLGYNPASSRVRDDNGHAVMEIELKVLKEPVFVSYSPELRRPDRAMDREVREGEEDDTYSEGALRMSLYSNEDTTALGLRRIGSLRTFEMNIVELSPRTSRGGSLSAGSVDGRPVYTLAEWRQWRCSLECVTQLYDEAVLRARGIVASPQDDYFYEQVRIQPFSSGAYLRGMLVAGFCSLFFNIYNIITWPDSFQEMTTVHSLVAYLLYGGLVLQLVFNLLQLPVRLQIHSFCWDSSRSTEVDVAINTLRTMLTSEMWVVNRVLGRVLDCISIGNLIFAELYLWCSHHSDPLRYLVVSLCATNLLTIVVRVFVATSFALSLHDPQILAEARRRGLSRWDLEKLPTFVFTSLDEVNNADCPICLAGFEMGEMLISLPCHKKHSFHAACIRQWLVRQNSCPLCQRSV